MHNDPANLRDLWGLSASDSKSNSLDAAVQSIADNLASKGQSKIAAKDIYYGNQKMTQALSVAVVGNTQYLDDKTSQSLQGKSAAEIEATLDQVTYVFGVSRDDVTKMRAELKAQGN